MSATRSAARGARPWPHRCLLNTQDDFSEQVSRFETPMRFGRIGQRILCADRHLQLRLFDRLVQSLELLRTRDETVQSHADVEPRSWKGFHPIQIRDSATSVLPKRIDTVLEPLAACESE